MNHIPWRTLYLVTMAVSFLLPLAATYLSYELGNARNFQYLAALLLLAALTGHYRQTVEVSVSRRAVIAILTCVVIGVVGSSLYHYWSFSINAIDFSVFDRMLYESHSGRFGYAPFCDCNHFGVHTNGVLLPLIALHAFWQSPYLLVLAQPLVACLALGPLSACARAFDYRVFFTLGLLLTFVSSKWLGGLLNYGFHPEVFYLPFGFWLLLAWQRGHTRQLLAASLGWLLVKEDAGLYLACFALGAWVCEPDKRQAALWLGVGGVLTFLSAHLWLQPLLRDGAPSFYGFWSAYGEGPIGVLKGMLSDPVRVLVDVGGSYWWVLLGPFLFLPLLHLGAALAILAGIVLHGTSANEHMQHFSLYYSAPLLPFVFWGFLYGLKRLQRANERNYEGVALVMLTAMSFVGGNYLNYPKPQFADMAAARQVQAGWDRDDRPCVQGSLIPHLPYEQPFRHLTQGCLEHANSAVYSDRYNAYPLTQPVSASIHRQGMVDARAAGNWRLAKRK